MAVVAVLCLIYLFVNPVYTESVDLRALADESDRNNIAIKQ
jgi:hypothetical protein